MPTSKRLLDLLTRHAEAMRRMWKETGGPQAWEAVLRYIWHVNPEIGREELVERLHTLIEPEMEQSIMTYAEKLTRRGREEGHRQALQQTLQAQIRKRFGRLPRAAAARIRAAESGQLALWLERILDAQTVEDIFAEAAPRQAQSVSGKVRSRLPVAR